MTMRRSSMGIGVRLLALCAVLSLIGGCSRDECSRTRMKIDALASTYSGSDPEGAYTECADALAKCPKIISAYKLMGAIDMAKKRYESAIANYSRAFELDPKDPEIAAAISRLSMNSVALTGMKIEISDRKITKTPFGMAGLSLKEYSQLEPDVRLAWLRASLDDMSRKTAEATRNSNRNVELTGSLAAFAEEVDADILAQAAASPNGRLGDAFGKSAMDAAMRHTTVTVVPK
jgi:tetratricopeptide (TPR) repeat protein